MHHAEMNWITPDAQAKIVHDARVSSDPEIANGPDKKLLNYLIRHNHWSPFEMANMNLTIYTTRDIGRQILRHRSFHFQEFSQRYADVSILGNMVTREARMKHPTNRQMSLECSDKKLSQEWMFSQEGVAMRAMEHYEKALKAGIAKEVARAILPEGMTPSKMHMNGTIRDWMFFIRVRTDPTAQKEVRMVADSAKKIFDREMPVISAAFFGSDK